MTEYDLNIPESRAEHVLRWGRNACGVIALTATAVAVEVPTMAPIKLAVGAAMGAALLEGARRTADVIVSPGPERP